MEPAQELEMELISRQEKIDKIIKDFTSPVQQFYQGSKVFVTGGTGFLGKHLIEKILRSTKVATLYLLVRSKKGKSIQERLKQIFEDPAYDGLREKRPDFENTIIPVEGDAAELRLGLSETDWKTIANEVDVIFHMAATTRFDEPLKVATLINVRGTREVLELAQECTKLRSFVHVSTAYTYACESTIDSDIEETFYPCPVDPSAVIKLAESTEEKRLDNLTPALIKNWPNTYTFAKAESEELLRIAGENLPICVVRPAIVTGAYYEPRPGWLDSSTIFGASGVIFGIGMGLMHTFILNEKNSIGLIPVDYVTNAILCSAWETDRRAAKKERDVKIYPVASPYRNPVRMLTLWNILMDMILTYASPKIIWYQYGCYTTNKYLFFVLSWYFHIIPAYLIDGVCLLIGRERRFVKLAKKMYRMTNVLSYFTMNEWRFVDKNLEDLYNSLSPVDKVIYNFDIPKIDWPEYVRAWCIGIRRYLVKDGVSGSKYAQKKMKWLMLAHYIWTVIYLYILYIIISLIYKCGYFLLNLIW